MTTNEIIRILASIRTDLLRDRAVIKYINLDMEIGSSIESDLDYAAVDILSAVNRFNAVIDRLTLGELR